MQSNLPLAGTPLEPGPDLRYREVSLGSTVVPKVIFNTVIFCGTALRSFYAPGHFVGLNYVFGQQILKVQKVCVTFFQPIHLTWKMLSVDCQ